MLHLIFSKLFVFFLTKQFKFTLVTPLFSPERKRRINVFCGKLIFEFVAKFLSAGEVGDSIFLNILMSVERDISTEIQNIPDYI